MITVYFVGPFDVRINSTPPSPRFLFTGQIDELHKLNCYRQTSSRPSLHPFQRNTAFMMGVNLARSFDRKKLLSIAIISSPSLSRSLV